MDNCIRKLLKMADEGFKFDENYLGEDKSQCIKRDVNKSC